MEYEDFLKTKQLLHKASGVEIDPSVVHELLKPHQRDVVKWAVKKGSAAVFLDAGLGKTFVQLEWARLVTDGMVLIFAPLSVARQTVKEALKLGQRIRFARSGEEIDPSSRIIITNYERAHLFDARAFSAVVLDESSILKSLDSKMRLQLTAQWKHAPYKLACTATPAPNDIKELVNHADFLGVMSRKEVFATFFINEGGDELKTRLKHHAVKPFYEWLASWAAAMKSPADLGYDANGYDLPPLNISTHIVETNYKPTDKLFFTDLGGVTERSKVQRETLEARVNEAGHLATCGPEQVIIWHHLNDEGYALRDRLSDAVLVEGSMSPDAKAQAFEDFQDGKYRVLITKPSIAGLGMNFQQSHIMVFCGINDSYEEYYQAVRRQWRFGQTEPVEAHVVYADVQQAIWENVQRKAREAEDLTYNLVEQIREYETVELRGQQRGADYQTEVETGQNWTLYLGDSCDPDGPMTQIADNSIGMAVFSPPFVARYAYTATERDLGNCRNLDQFMDQWQYQIDHLMRVMMPGRNVCVHCQQVRTTARDTGAVGLIDFRGAIIRAFVNAGFTYYSDFTIQKSAQMQAKRKHHVALLYKTKNRDSSKSGSALADYLLVFKKPGENPVRIDTCDVPDKTWNSWAQPVWYDDDVKGEGFRQNLERMSRDQLVEMVQSLMPTWEDINEIDVISTQQSRADDDEMHLAPLQLGFIERCVRLWSKPGELVLTPFAGVGSELYQSILLGRRAVGIELKPEYWRTAIKNLTEAESQVGALDLFQWAEQQATVESEAV